MPAFIFPFRITSILFLLNLTLTKSLPANNPANYTVTIETYHSTYENYRIASITDTSITIYKNDREEKADPVTLNAVQIIQIATTRTNGTLLAYLGSVGVGTGAGYLWALRQVEKHGANGSGSYYNTAGIYKFMGLSVGLFCGLVAGVIIDTSIHQTYHIDMREENFRKFSGKWGG